MSSDLYVVLLYLAIVLVVAIWASCGRNKVTSFRDYVLGRSFYTTPVLVVTLLATGVDSVSISGVIAEVFEHGVMYILLFLGLPVSRLLVAKFIAPRMALYRGVLTAGDIMQQHYGVGARIATGIAAILLHIGYIIAQILAAGNISAFFLEIPAEYGIIVSCGIALFYTVWGGIRAVVYTDIVQCMALVVAIAIICVLSINAGGGYISLLQELPQTSYESLAMQYWGWVLVFYLPFLDPTLMQRMLMAKGGKQLMKMLYSTAALEFFIYIVLGMLGLLAIAMHLEVVPSMALSHLINALVPVGIKGVVVMGLLAALMSSADSHFNCVGISAVNDIIRPLWRDNMLDKTALLLSRLVTLVVGVVAIAMAFIYMDFFSIVMHGLYLWSAIVVIPLLAGIMGLKTSKSTFYCGMVAGILSLSLGLLLVESVVNIIALAITGGALGFFASYFFSSALRFPKLAKLIGYFPSIAKMLQFSTARVNSYGAQYMLFGVFAISNYLMPYFMWGDSTAVHDNSYTLIAVRYSVGIVSAVLLCHEFWPQLLKKYLPLYWHFAVLYCLPFSSTYLLLENSASMDWLFNVALSLFLLAMLVDWLSFIIVFSLGVLLSVVAYMAINGSIIISIEYANLFKAGYIYMFAIVIGLIFSRSNERSAQEKTNTIKALSGAIAHEMRTPLAAIAMGAGTLKEHLPAIVEGYSLAKAAGLPVTQLSSKHQKNIIEIPEMLTHVSRNSQMIIDMLLMKIRDNPVAGDFKTHCISSCITSAVTEYPLTDNQRKQVYWDLKDDFQFVGNLLAVKHVLFNLLKNALYHIAAANRENSGKINIWLSQEGDSNVLHFKDTGRGIPLHMLPKIFDQFYTRTKYGTGIGLAFCKLVMETIGGDITCHSIEGEYAEFKLHFQQSRGQRQREIMQQ